MTAYEYDNSGNLFRVIRAAGDSSYERVTDYVYDGLNRVRSETQYPDWPTTTYTSPVGARALYAGQSVGAVRGRQPAAAIIAELTDEAEAILRQRTGGVSS